MESAGLLTDRAVIILSLIIAASGMYLLTFMQKFFLKLQNQHRDYYLQIGSPSYKLGDFKHRKSAAFFVFRLFLGIPKGFPSDSGLRRELRIHQLCLYAMIVLITVGVSLVAATQL